MIMKISPDAQCLQEMYIFPLLKLSSQGFFLSLPLYPMARTLGIKELVQSVLFKMKQKNSIKLLL